MSRIQHPPFRHAALVTALSVALLLGGCAVAPTPMTAEEHRTRVEQDRRVLFKDQEAITAPIGLYDAMARALKYNLDHRVKAMEQALARHEFNVSRLDLLPRLVADVQREGRSNTPAASSESIITGQQSLEPSTSSDQWRTTQNLTMVWNVLDFGVSYVRAQQAADSALIAEERRRKVVEMLLQDVRGAYWRAASAQRLLARIDPLIMQVNAAIEDSRAIEQRRLGEPMDALQYQRTLLDTLRQLQALRKELVVAKARLAALMNLPPNQDFTLALGKDDAVIPELPHDLVALEDFALMHRPEVREEVYRTRISAAESRKALLQLLPGIELSYGWSYDSNSFLVNNEWEHYGLRATWNLFNVFTAGARLDAAEAQEDVAKARRLAMNMAVMTQVHVAYANAVEALQGYRVADRLNEVDGRILDQLRARIATRRAGQLDLIRGELNAVIAELRRDMAFAEAHGAVGQVYASIGADALPETVSAHDVKSLAQAVRDAMGRWPALPTTGTRTEPAATNR